MTKDVSNQTDAVGNHEIDRKLLEILICPLSKGPLDYNAQTKELISPRAGVAFPVLDGIPMMTEDASRPLSDAEQSRYKSASPKAR